MLKREDYVVANRDAWNEVAPRHSEHNQARLKALFAAGGYNHLDSEMIAMLERIGVGRKPVVQVGCNNGIDLLSVKGMGAGECLGIDQAPAFLEQARELAGIAGHDDVIFWEGNVYALPGELAGRFDIAMTTIGVLHWMSDLEAFFQAVTDLIAPGGYWVMEETHPMVLMYEEGEDGGGSKLAYSYFRTEPLKWDDGLDYFGDERYEANPCYSFMYKMSDVVNAGIGAGLELLHMQEVDRDISNHCADIEHVQANPAQGL